MRNDGNGLFHEYFGGGGAAAEDVEAGGGGSGAAGGAVEAELFGGNRGVGAGRLGGDG